MTCPNCKKYEQLTTLLKDLLGLSNVAEPTAKTALDFASEEVGVEEIPRGSNDGERVREYLRAGGCTIPAPWCAGFIMWCLNQAGIKPFITAHVATMWDKNKTIQKFSPQVGDVFIQINKNGSGHCGFVERVAGDSVDTIEGNTNDEGSREGFEVCRRTRNQNTIRGYLRFK